MFFFLCVFELSSLILMFLVFCVFCVCFLGCFLSVSVFLVAFVVIVVFVCLSLAFSVRLPLFMVLRFLLLRILLPAGADHDFCREACEPREMVSSRMDIIIIHLCTGFTIAE